MCHADNEKWKKRNNGRKLTAKSGKHQNSWIEVKLRVLGNIGSGHHQANRAAMKNLKTSTSPEHENCSKSSSPTKISLKNTWAVLLVSYSVPFLRWTREKLGQMDQTTRKFMTMHKSLHLRDDIDRLCASNVDDCVDAPIQEIEKFTKRAKKTNYRSK